jgi:hypothetical protein
MDQDRGEVELLGHGYFADDTGVSIVFDERGFSYVSKDGIPQRMHVKAYVDCFEGDREYWYRDGDRVRLEFSTILTTATEAVQESDGEWGWYISEGDREYWYKDWDRGQSGWPTPFMGTAALKGFGVDVVQEWSSSPRPGR